MSRGKVLAVPGHTVGRDNEQAHQAYDDRGLPIDGRAGHAKCTCREISPTSLPTVTARRHWLRRHREEIAGVPWSDAAMAGEYA